MTADVAIVQRIHRKIWETTIYRPDPIGEDIWGSFSWEGGKVAGDCEEWAERAASALLGAGIAPKDVALALCHTEGDYGYNHAICLVNAEGLGLMNCGDSFDEGGPRPIRTTGYSFSRMMRLSEPGVWRVVPTGWPYKVEG